MKTVFKLPGGISREDGSLGTLSMKNVSERLLFHFKSGHRNSTKVNLDNGNFTIYGLR